MEQNIQSSRLRALDGLRGLAILMVFLNHVNPEFLLRFFSTNAQAYLSTFFDSGITGVSFLFILSGFFMAYIYPHSVSSVAFLQKRYTRIFPLFLTVCFFVFLLRLFPNLEGLEQIAILIFLATIVHGVWVFGIKKIASVTLSRILFLSFVLLQITIGALYVFWIMRHPPQVFNQELSPEIREGIIGLVNATLTLPLGNYIPMLDGVYWSLAAEVFFYIIYVFFLIPCISLLIPHKRAIKIIVLLTLIPFLVGSTIISHHVLRIDMLQLPLFSYFVTGVVLGYLYRHKSDSLLRVSNFFGDRLFATTILYFFAVILFKKIVLQSVGSPQIDPWIHIFFSIPFAVVVLFALNDRTKLAKLLHSPVLVGLGVISYSMYLTHVFIIHLVKKYIVVSDIPTNIFFIIISFAFVVIISMILQHLLEKPYFAKTKKIYHPKSISTGNAAKRPLILLGALCFGYVFFTVSVFQSNFNFFSDEYAHTRTVFIKPKVESKKKILSMGEYPKVTMQFQAEQQSLGIITMYIAHKTLAGKPTSPQTLTFRIKEMQSNSWYATASFDVFRISDGFNKHPFGFPTITDSRGKSYLVELFLSQPESSEVIAIQTGEGTIKSVYATDKFQLIQNPLQFFSFTKIRIVNAFTSPDMQYALFLFLPFAGTCILLFVKRKILRPLR